MYTLPCNYAAAGIANSSNTAVSKFYHSSAAYLPTYPAGHSLYVVYIAIYLPFASPHHPFVDLY